MYLAVGVWIATALFEAGLYSSAPRSISRPRELRWVISLLTGICVVGSDFLLFSQVTAYWPVLLVLTPYRLLNLARFAVFRLHPAKLGSLGLQSHRWLITGQIILMLLLLLTHVFSLISLLRAVGLLQLLGALILLRSSLLTWRYSRPSIPEQFVANKELPTMSVLIPARDETKALQACLDSLVTSDYPKLEIIVLDDCSMQRKTADIIRSYSQSGVRFIKGEEVPDGWLAKNYGCEQLRQAASGEVLVYCGADTTFGSKTLRRMAELMITQDKRMLSVLPTRPSGEAYMTVLQTMRYYWELCFPRRLFKRPPVLSSCWAIYTEALESFGGFKCVAQSTAPEAHFARRTVVSNEYRFIRNSDDLQVYSNKNYHEQMATALRTRYPQMHRRLELVALCSLFELAIFISPIIGVISAIWVDYMVIVTTAWILTTATVIFMYYLIAVRCRLHRPWFAVLVAPVAFLVDIVVLHISMYRYEFGSVDWKGRNVCIPVMQLSETAEQPRPKTAQ